MKKSILVGIVLFTGLLVSCNDEMNYKEFTQYDEEYVKKNFDYVSGLVTNAYSYLDDDLGSYDGAMMASATDEAEYVYTDNPIYTFINGGWNPVSAQDEAWKKNYQGIQQVNMFLERFQGLTFPEIDQNDEYQAKIAQYNRFSYEVRALRAYYYFNLAKQYGDVPLFTKLITVDEVNRLTRTPVHEVFQFIIDECDAIMEQVPWKWSEVHSDLQDIDHAGRVNKMFVLALRARTALYAASPLFCPQGEEQSMWNRAALYNQEVINAAIAHNYSLLTNYEDIWGENNYKSAEVIFAKRKGVSRTYEEYNFPMGVEGGKGGNCPTQNLVDAYEMLNGKAISESGSGYDPQRPYWGRDPRLALTVAVNGEEKWPDYNSATLETFYGGLNGEPLAGATPTGYYLKKQMNHSVILQAGKANEKLHSWVIFRLGEFFLNYAEAAFKATKSAVGVPEGCSLTAIEAVNIIRNRVGMPALDNSLSSEAFLQKYENERFIELAFENHRFWDLRRWKKGDKLKSITRMKITKKADGTFIYTRKEISREWDDKMYLFPIPQSERLKNPNLSQNPGWE